MNVFLTGGSGFVGGAMIAAWSERHQVRAMSRSPASDERIRKLGAEPLRCALGEVTAAQLAGSETVVHAAAHVEEWGPRSVYWQANVEGTRQLLEVAQTAGVRRFVHVGTEAALFYGQPMVDVDESYPLALDSPFPYSQTKAHAEKLVREAADGRQGFETIVIRPRMIWGPGDETILGALKDMTAQGRFSWLDEGHARTCTTHVANLVHAMELALTGGKNGQAYFVLDDGVRTLREFFSEYAATAGIQLPDKSISGTLARGLAGTLEPLWRGLRLKSPPPLTRFAAALMSRDCVLRDDLARAELGYSPVISVPEGLDALRPGR